MLLKMMMLYAMTHPSCSRGPKRSDDARRRAHHQFIFGGLLTTRTTTHDNPYTVCCARVPLKSGRGAGRGRDIFFFSLFARFFAFGRRHAKTTPDSIQLYSPRERLSVFRTLA